MRAGGKTIKNNNTMLSALWASLVASVLETREESATNMVYAYPRHYVARR